MIVVSVGTNEARFDRLLEWVSAVVSEEPMVVQHGPSEIRPPGARCVAYLPYEQLVALIRQSRRFVTHAGVGSVMASLAVGRRPIVVPRLRRFGEAVDDHQLPFARKLADRGLVSLVEAPEGLAAELDAPERTVPHELGPPALVAELRSYLTQHVRTVG